MFLAYEIQKARKKRNLEHALSNQARLKYLVDAEPKRKTVAERISELKKAPAVVHVHKNPEPLEIDIDLGTDDYDPKENQKTDLEGFDMKAWDIIGDKKEDYKVNSPIIKPMQPPMGFVEPPEPEVGKCPHCKLKFVVYKTEIGCQVFRHGVYKHNNEPINPHAPKDFCDQMVKEGKIWGCGKPFKYDGKIATVCEYI